MLKLVFENSTSLISKHRPYFIGHFLIREEIVKPSEGLALLNSLKKYNLNLSLSFPAFILPAFYFLISPTLYTATISASMYLVSYPLLERAGNKRIQELENVVKSHLTPENIQKLQTYIKNSREHELVVNVVSNYLDSISNTSHKLDN